MNKSMPYIIALIALALGFAGSWYVQSSKPIKLEVSRWFGEQARTLPEFELLDQDNQPFGKAQMKGKWTMMYFGYTHCPDICPVTVKAMAEMLEAIDTLAFMKMDQRIYTYLTNKVKIMRSPVLNTTHQNIADDLNTSRVVVSRLLKQLENEKKIKLHRNRIEVLVY